MFKSISSAYNGSTDNKQCSVDLKKDNNNYISALLALILWGGWAFYINSSTSILSGITSGLTQGTASFIITILMIKSVNFWLLKFKHRITKALFPALITISCSSLGLVIAHYLAGTPNIIFTIAPAITVAFLFCIFTSYQLQRESKP